MLNNFFIVSQQVLILFVLIAVGFVCGKIKLIKEVDSKLLTNIVLYLATPCVIIRSFQEVEFNYNLLINLLITVICASLIHIGAIVILKLIFRNNKEENRKKVLQFSAVFSNCGFMSLPLQNALLGSEGVFYGSIFVGIFNVFVWSYGFLEMSGNSEKISVKKIFLNPGVVSVTFAVILFFTQIKLPEIIFSPINYLAGLNTPVPMLIIGYYLSQTNLKVAFKDKGVYSVIGLRLLLIPVLSMIIMFLCGVDETILIPCVVASSAPVAATTTMFSNKFNRDVDLSVALVSVTTLFSIVTMPVVIAIAQSIF